MRYLAWIGLLAGCSAGGSLSGEALTNRMAVLAQQGDTVALARLAARQCGDLRDEARRSCFEAYFLDLATGNRVRVALGALAALAATDRSIESDGHSYTHVIGIRAWEPGMDVAEVFASCTGLFQSGCYHGVIQAYLTADGGADSIKVARLCDRIERIAGERWLRFQCVHGLGHGLEMIHNWDLPRALAGCDWLVSNWDRESCYGGAFMENAVASMPGGHHTSARALAADGGMAGHAGHGGAGHAAPDPATITFQMRDSSDLLYPCSAVGDRYQASCFLLQGGMILQHLDLDFARAAAVCDRAPTRVRHNCYLSLGTYASGLTVRDSRGAVGYCSHGDPGYQPWCFVGVVKNYIDVTARPEDGIAFCREVPPGRNRRQCWAAVGEQIRVLHATDLAAAERACAAADPEGGPGCRYGAGLLGTPPAGYPVRPGEQD